MGKDSNKEQNSETEYRKRDKREVSDSEGSNHKRSRGEKKSRRN